MRLKAWVVGVAGAVLGAAAPAQAQYPGYPYPGFGTAPGYQSPYPYAPLPSPGNYLPNYYNRQSQPLSPYLNLLRGGNTGVNYFYGVRPGTQGGGVPVGGGFGMTTGYGMFRPNVLPTTLAPTEEPIPVDPAGEPISRLMPTGHPVYFTGGPGGAGGATGRPGFMRVGTGTPPPARPTTGITPPRR